MGKDKKVRDGRITLILPRRIGDAFVMKDAPVGRTAAISQRGGLTLTHPALGRVPLSQCGRGCRAQRGG